MIDSDATRLRMIKAVGGVLVRHSEGSFWGVFDEFHESVLDGMVEAKGPAIEARSIDVQALPRDTSLEVSPNASLGVPGGDYRIKNHEPGRTGWTVLILKL